MAVVKCPVCQREATKWDVVVPPNRRAGHELFKCGICGHGFFYPPVDREELLQFYNEQYAKRYTPDLNDAIFALRTKQYRIDAASLLEHVTHPAPSVLDFGCSTGQFLNALPESWKKFGYEVNAFELEYIATHYQNIVTFNSLQAAMAGRYDVVILRGVIEHLFAFDELFVLLSASLNGNGLVYICATPDFDSPCARLYKSKWNQIAAIQMGGLEHYHQFTSASLAILFGRHGFGMKMLRHGYLETPYANFASDACRFVENCRRTSIGEPMTDCTHPYPGTMMTALLQRVERRDDVL